MVGIAKLAPHFWPVLNPGIALVTANMSGMPDSIHVPLAAGLGRFVCVPGESGIGSAEFSLRMILAAQPGNIERLRELAERAFEMEFALVGFLVECVGVLIADPPLAEKQ